MEFTEESRSKFAAIGEIADEVLGLMEELYQSGFDTVHDSTLQRLEKFAKQTGQYGMKYLSELLDQLAGEISAGRHQMERRTAKMMELFVEINEYLYLCEQKVTYDQGRAQYI